MTATSLNHVSICAPDLEVAIHFYRDLLGLEELPTPNFGFPVRWMRVGSLQLHLFQKPEQIPTFQHLALTVDDFEAVYKAARELGIQDNDTFGHHLYLLPGQNVQLYLRDPSGNLIEIDWPDVTSLDPDLISEIRPLPQPQGQMNLRSTLFLPK